MINVKIGTLRCGLTPAEVRAVFDRVAAGLTAALVEMRHYAGAYEGFRPIAGKMEEQWREGITSL